MTRTVIILQTLPHMTRTVIILQTLPHMTRTVIISVSPICTVLDILERQRETESKNATGNSRSSKHYFASSTEPT
jgi:hypothetical protein